MHDLVGYRAFESEFTNSVVIQVFAINVNMESSCIDFPAFRSGQLFQSIMTMREVTGKGAFAVLISHSDSYQAALGERTAGILDLFMIEKTEDKAFTRYSLDLAGNQSFVMLLGYDNLFRLGEIDFRRKELIRHTYGFYDHRGFLIRSLQEYIIAVFIHLISGRSAFFSNVIMSQRQQRTFILSFGSRGDSRGNLISFEPLGSFLTNNVFYSTNLVDSAFKVAFMVVRSKNSMAG